MEAQGTLKFGHSIENPVPTSGDLPRFCGSTTAFCVSSSVSKGVWRPNRARTVLKTVKGSWWNVKGRWSVAVKIAF